jgi:uncharacterized membrane protein
MADSIQPEAGNATQPTQDPQNPGQAAAPVGVQVGDGIVAGTQNAGAQISQGAQQGVAAAAEVGGQVMQGVGNATQVASQVVGNVADLLKPVANQPKVTQEEKIFGAVSYVPMIQLITLMFKPDSAYVRLHARQGLLMFGLFFLCIFLYIIPYLGPVFAGLIQFGLMVLGLFSIYQALIGNWWKIPVLGDIAEMIPTDWLTQVSKEMVTGQIGTPTDVNQNAGGADQQK